MFLNTIKRLKSGKLLNEPIAIFFAGGSFILLVTLTILIMTYSVANLINNNNNPQVPVSFVSYIAEPINESPENTQNEVTNQEEVVVAEPEKPVNQTVPTNTTPTPTPVAPPVPVVQGPLGPDSPIVQRVQNIVYYKGHNPSKTFNHSALTEQLRQKLIEASTFKKYKDSTSRANVSFQIVKTTVLEQTAPQKGNNCDQYLPEIIAGTWTTSDWQSTNCWGSGTADYNKMLADNSVCEYLNTNVIDEVWIWGFGNGGFWEANMAGTGAYWTNGPVINGTSCQKAIHVMGFNYELPYEYALHSIGHRIEGTMRNFLSSEFNSFSVYQANGNSSCGSVHFPSNGKADYDYGNSTYTSSDCSDWSVNHTGARESINCTKWGCSQAGYMMWWLQNIPGDNNRLTRFNDNAMPNWWKLITKNTY